MAEAISPVTSYGRNGEKAPEAHVLAEKLEDGGVEAASPLTGDHVLFVAEEDLTSEVRRTIDQSHYTKGKPRAAPSPGDGYVAFKPKRGYHPDGH